MSGVGKIATERNQRTLLELLAKPGNDVCADCKSRYPRWASHSLGIFICVNCASIHRKMGTHVSKIKSVTLDSWTKEQVESMKAMGNLKSNAVYNPNETRNPPPPALADPENDPELESYIRSKYQYKKFIDKAALVALKLGPASNAATPRSASTPFVNQKVSTPPSIPSSASVPSAVSKPSEASVPSLPLRRSTTVHPTSSARSASQPVPQVQHVQQQRTDGVWSDLISLQEPGRNSFLPLQYQVPQATQTMNQSSSSMGASVMGNMFTSSLQTASPVAATSYYQSSFPQSSFPQSSFPQTSQSPSFPPANVFMHSAPVSTVPTGFALGSTTPQLQQQYLHPQPIQAGPSLSVPQPMMQQTQFTTPSPVMHSTPSPAIGLFTNPSYQLPVPSPGVGYLQAYSTVTVNQPGVVMTGAPQMSAAMPVQSGTAMGFMQPQVPLGYTGGIYPTQTGFGNTGQWGPL